MHPGIHNTQSEAEAEAEAMKTRETRHTSGKLVTARSLPALFLRPTNSAGPSPILKWDWSGGILQEFLSRRQILRLLVLGEIVFT